MKEVHEHWQTDRLHQIEPEEFFDLIQRNRKHIQKTFPGTLERSKTLEDTIAFLYENVHKEESGDGYYFYLRDTKSQMLIGYVLIKNVVRNIGKCEIAYFVDREFEGKGIITKAVSNLLEFCFGELSMNKVTICTSPENAASQRIATKHGFKNEGMLRQEFKNGDGNLEDIFYFGLLKSNYDER
ncbi:GNAT family N-acetyltransferase [Flavobacterium silvaticum]|uniref:GNAT family N-acetyltransferase n=1 Tax=Flavobacterium silvaticum TaxID=1852020 RepID=A0A972FS27_9FLAO|nr:GNAT family N-acetyltransferase [Flavobacterium silvaticum]NMH28324.1 GNAT family N-acetyltransferase [Flavobacterium silvaticum]